MCKETVEPYPTDVTDEQWDLLKEYWPAPKAPNTRGRPPVDQRRVCNALLYFVRGGCAWRMMPHDFGHWETIYGYFRRFKRDGHWQRIHDILRGEVRAQVGKRSQPTAAILDSQSVRAADQAGERGYDKGKNIKGIKRHILVDTLGLLLAVFITPADVQEREGARGFLSPVLAAFRWLRCIWADQGYNGEPFANWVAAHRKTGTLRLEVVSRQKDQRGFMVLTKRWIVERTFGWFMQHRRLVRHYEVKTDSAEAWLHIAMIGIMLRRLA
jgi:putative transposase